ncbi:hypothetical protein FQN53_006402 [Emmonsiellopsis sp. PD_33]|nr:hypothetical protein FQN53_006402 [Emmonsiellopsis sp. PD_33]
MLLLFTRALIPAIVLYGLGIDAAPAGPPTTNLSVSAVTAQVEADNSVIHYARKEENSLLIGNDGSAATGGFRAWNLFDNRNETNSLPEVAGSTHGRSKPVAVLYDVAGKDLVVSIAATDSVIRVFNVDGMAELSSNKKVMLGDWSALCSWRAPVTARQYFYLLGKKQAVQFVIRGKGNGYEILEVQTFDLPVEPSSCVVAPRDGTVYFVADDDKNIYRFQAEESITPPKVTVLGEVENEVTGIALYVGSRSDHLFVAQSDIIEVHSTKLELQGSLKLTGFEEIEAQGLSIYQDETHGYHDGVLSFAIETEAGTSYGISSLEPVFKDLKLEPNKDYNPRPIKPESPNDNLNGFPNRQGSPHCFSGFMGPRCSQFTCKNDCSGHGQCVGPNVCRCTNSWSGPDCSFVLVTPKCETEANGGDGDDPAIWISSGSPNQSTVITTTKSTEGAGLTVFDLAGKQLQTMKAGEPNNVDVIYGFKAGNRTIDLAYAACRADDELCLFEITPQGLLAQIPGGTQPTPPDYTVYGSCAYRSRTTGKQYLFVNSKSAEYLQYELTSHPNGTLTTTLVRSFTGGSGGQVEGCVTDEDAATLFVGEESHGLWRYDAEPTGSTSGTLVARVGDGSLYADVEGITLIPGKTVTEGFLIVSCQGISAYAVFRRAPPHAHVLTFTIGASSDGSVDAVSNTDGVAGVGTALSADFPNGLVIVHDDANQLGPPAGGSTAPLASFKMVSLLEVLGERLIGEVDSGWGLDR